MKSQESGAFSQQGERSLNRSGRKELHHGPHKGTLIVSLEELDANR